MWHLELGVSWGGGGDPASTSQEGQQSPPTNQTRLNGTWGMTLVGSWWPGHWELIKQMTHCTPVWQAHQQKQGRQVRSEGVTSESCTGGPAPHRLPRWRRCTRWRKGHRRVHAVPPSPEWESWRLAGWANQRGVLFNALSFKNIKGSLQPGEAIVRGEKSHPQLALWLAGGLEIVTVKFIAKSTEAKMQMLHFAVGSGRWEGPQKGQKNLANRYSEGEWVWISWTFTASCKKSQQGHFLWGHIPADTTCGWHPTLS